MCVSFKLIFVKTILCLILAGNGQLIEQASVGELYAFKIEPTIFNWSRQATNNEQFRYTASLKSYPDLPSWMRYMYSQEHSAGFLYGTPPEKFSNQAITLDIIALNKNTYETRYAALTIEIAHKVHATNVVHMKIDNLNWIHLMDPGRVENLFNIFRKELWPESEHDLSLVFMESAVNMGGRLPLRPQQHEGVIVHLGSFAAFSQRLKDLQEEIRPLYKLSSCTYKRTSVQKIFENAGFKLDWCAFKIVGSDINPEVSHHNHYGNRFHGAVNKHVNLNLLRNYENHWYGIHREDVPYRNYIDEIAFAFAIPAVIFGILCGILTASLCFKDEKLFKTSLDSLSSTVQMVQYSNANCQPVTTLKTLKDVHCIIDNNSVRSESPNFHQMERNPSVYLRPKPPPYKSALLHHNEVNI